MAEAWSTMLERTARPAAARTSGPAGRPGRLQDAYHFYREPLHCDADHPDTLHLAAIQAARAGRLVEALELVDRALTRLPGFAEAHNTRGNLLRLLGSADEAIGAFRQAIVLAPRDPLPWCNLGNALQELGRPEDAVRVYREAITRAPGLAEAQLNLGIVLGELGQQEEALEACEMAAGLRPELGTAHAELGTAVRRLGRLAEAIDHYRRAVNLDPTLTFAWCELGTALWEEGRHHEAAEALQAALALDHGLAEAHNAMGNVCRSLGYLDQAVSAYRQALAERPDYVEAHFNLGVLLADLHRPVEALASFRAALTFQPDHAEALARMGSAFLRLGRPGEAVPVLRRALSLDPRPPLGWFQLGQALDEEGQSASAAEAYAQAIEREPGDAESHWRRALALLTAGSYEGAWEEYRWRGRASGEGGGHATFEVPEWRGQPLEGRRILVRADQGLEETLLFARYLPLVAARGGRIVLECQPTLVRLLESMPAVSQILGRGDAVPAVDCQVALESLPGVFGTRETTVPSSFPYLPITSWSGRVPLLPGGRGLRVGITWGSSRRHETAVTLQDLAPLFQLPGITWYSLETGPARGELGGFADNKAIHDLAPLIRDLSDTSAILGQLDLLIAVEGPAAHLAGALGLPVWVLLGSRPDWRWQTEQGESLWYPSAQAFTRPRVAGWREVVDEVGRLLAAGTAAPGGPQA